MRHRSEPEPTPLPVAQTGRIHLRDGAHFAQIKAQMEGHGHRLTAFKPLQSRIGAAAAWGVHCRYLVRGYRAFERAHLRCAPALFEPCMGNPLTNGAEPATPEDVTTPCGPDPAGLDAG